MFCEKYLELRDFLVFISEQFSLPGGLSYFSPEMKKSDVTKIGSSRHCRPLPAIAGKKMRRC